MKLRAVVGAGALVSSLLALPLAPANASPPPVKEMAVPRTSPDLDSLRARANALRDELAVLEGKSERIHERLGYARNQMAAATSSSISAGQQLQELQGQSTEAQLELAYRVRAIEQSGGAPALYSQAIDADKLTDVTSNVAALNAVLTSDIVHADDSASAAQQMTVIDTRLHHLADEKTELAKHAETLAHRAHRLVEQQRALLADANADVRRLAARIQRQQEREAAAQGTSSTWKKPIPDGPTPYAQAAIAAALSKLGSPYVWGAEGPDTFDCSGLVQWSYAQAGLVLPRLASDQYFASTPVPVNQMAPGDLIVYAYDTSDSSTIHHITMYIGNGLMVHAPHTGDVVRVAPVYYDGLYGVARPGL